MPADTRIDAITLHQPWATLIAIGAKTIETRGWPVPRHLLGRRIAIHAARTDRSIRDLATRDRLPYEHNVGGPIGAYRAEVCVRGDGLVHQLGEAWLTREPCPNSLVEHTPLPFGAIVCTAVLAACFPIVDAAASSGPRWLVAGDGSVSLVDDDPGFAHPWEHERRAGAHADEGQYGWFAPGRYGWLFAGVQRLDPPISATGAQGFWKWTHG